MTLFSNGGPLITGNIGGGSSTYILNSNPPQKVIFDSVDNVWIFSLGATTSAPVLNQIWQRVSDPVTGNALIDYNPSYTTSSTDDFVAGPQSTEGGGTGILMINKNSGTFSDLGSIRAGSSTSTAWNESNRGTASVAFGKDNVASGAYSGALAGQTNTASGQKKNTLLKKNNRSKKGFRSGNSTQFLRISSMSAAVEHFWTRKYS